ncbi:MAG: VOC family protein [Pseudomonadota bacterium]
MTYMIRQMGHVAFNSPDPESAAQDLVEIVGMRITERDGDTIYLSSNRRHHEISFTKGKAGTVRAIGLEAVSTEAVDEVRRRAQSDGLEILDDKPLGKHYDRAVRFVAPGGAIFEVHAPIARNQPADYIGVGANPKRLEHINAFAPDVAVFGEFCEKVLGMKLSDRTDDGRLRWYRAQDGFHHTVAMGTGENVLHHYAFDQYAMEDLVAIADTLTLKGRAMAWGPGRHGAGGNIFTYYADPHGCIVENSVQMDHIDNDAVYTPGDWDASQGLNGKWINLWGTPPTPAFLVPGIPFER